MMNNSVNKWAGSATDLAKYYPPSDSNSVNGYIRISRNNVVQYMHRFIWKELVGPIPKGYEIDHINGIRTDNRLENLRCIPQDENKRNTKTREDRDRKMNFDFWEYDPTDLVYHLNFKMIAEDCLVSTKVSIKMETLIKWCEQHERSSLNVIKELRTLFSLSQISTKV